MCIVCIVLDWMVLYSIMYWIYSTEYQKTIEDRQKEQELVEELLKIVNERDRLEQRKLTYEVE